VDGLIAPLRSTSCQLVQWDGGCPANALGRASVTPALIIATAPAFFEPYSKKQQSPISSYSPLITRHFSCEN
jgi:hypothetical protein